MTLEIGCDVSRLNRPSACNYAEMAKHVKFAIVRATYGAFDTDDSAPTHFAGFRDAGCDVGLYAFALAHHPVKSFVEQVLSVANRCKWTPCDMPIFIDCERPPGGTPAARAHDGMSAAQRVEWLIAVLDQLYLATHTVCGIYSGPNYWRTCMDSTLAFAGRPLWAARYPLGVRVLHTSDDVPSKQPVPFGGWPTWDIWQYTGRGMVPGYAGNAIDLNVRRRLP